MKHLDLFSGIGGFAIAVDEVWPGSEHIFCDNDKFCQAVLKKHWPQSKIYGDIRELTADTDILRPQEQGAEQQTERNRQNNQTIADTASSRVPEEDRPIQSKDGEVLSKNWERFRNVSDAKDTDIDILTGGFPCQPFSQAGKRNGTNDDRYLWPEMLRVIREFEPTFVIAENVRGLLTLQQGVVFEQVCLDLEASGYEVQPLIIPAVAVNAPHRRDRVWFIANRKGINEARSDTERNKSRQSEREIGNGDSNSKNTKCERRGGGLEDNGQILESGCSKVENERPDWERNWIEVATELCGVDDGLPVELDGLKLSKAGHRNAQLKAYGNAIVPQVAIEIMKSIKSLINI